VASRTGHKKNLYSGLATKQIPLLSRAVEFQAHSLSSDALFPAEFVILFVIIASFFSPNAQKAP
jgi:hypothetical protein